jgi:hypothetical protein
MSNVSVYLLDLLTAQASNILRSLKRELAMAEMHPPPPAYIHLVQLRAQSGQNPDNPDQVEPPPVKVDVMRYIPASALSVTMLVTVTPPNGMALIFTQGNEESPVVFKGPKSINEIRLSGPFVYVKLVGATSFDIQYLSYREPAN